MKLKILFLHGDLDEEIHMIVPSRFEESYGTNKVCKLKEALCGLKQSPRAWFGKFTKTMKILGFK